MRRPTARARWLAPRAPRVIAGLVACLVAPPLPGIAQEPTLEDAVDTTRVTVGDRVRLTVSVDHAPGARVVWPDSLDVAPFEVLSARAFAPTPTAEGVRSGLELTLAAFELGDLEIPSFEIVIEGPGSERRVLDTHGFGIEVVSVGTDEGGEIRDIRGPFGIPISVVRVGGWALLALAVVLAVAWAARRFRARPQPGARPGPVAPMRSPEELALESLAEIERSSMLEMGQVKEFHIAVSEVLRTWVERRFRVPALEMTTREVMGGLARVGVGGELAHALRDVLDRCDLVKFAKLRPDVAASSRILEAGRSLVEAARRDGTREPVGAGVEGA